MRNRRKLIMSSFNFCSYNKGLRHPKVTREEISNELTQHPQLTWDQAKMIVIQHKEKGLK